LGTKEEVTGNGQREPETGFSTLPVDTNTGKKKTWKEPPTQHPEGGEGEKKRQIQGFERGVTISGNKQMGGANENKGKTSSVAGEGAEPNLEFGGTGKGGGVLQSKRQIPRCMPLRGLK